MIQYADKIGQELNIKQPQVKSTLQLLEEGGTVPFISRYRKEVTGNLDEVAILAIKNLSEKLVELDKRRTAILKSIEEQGKLTADLKRKIEESNSLSQLEDLYLPYRPKRRTRATIAKEKGLEPLADWLWKANQVGDLDEEAKKFLSKEHEVADINEALAGARDIIAEQINEDAEIRQFIRPFFQKTSVLTSALIKGKEEEGQKYKDYFEWSEKLKDIPSHRLLAIRRGEKEMILKVDISPDKDEAISRLRRRLPAQRDPKIMEQLEICAEDCYQRLMKPSLETEMRVESKKKADTEAIGVFGSNLKELLMAPALGQKRIMAVDPGFRTGCKIVCLDAQGKLLDNAAIYPNEPQKKTTESRALVLHLLQQFQVEAVAIGNGTASRETEAFFRSLETELPVIMVNESGASVYSASDVAREEFPDHDITVRGAVSIGRRLQDPLAELVKLDPKSIGVGQYQHDVDQNELKKSLDIVVESCVNAVGVELNTASKQLLNYVSGLGPSLSQNIIAYREKEGAFTRRMNLKQVARMGEKVFEQCAGFLRIRNADNPLDSSGVHPERYPLVEKMASDLNCSVTDLIQQADLRKQIKLEKYVDSEVGLPTLQDIIKELEKPGRDPREKFEFFSFREGVEKPEDLTSGMELPGIVTNVTKFGAFVDIGVHQDGLVHISELTDRFISDPTEVVKVHQKVQVKVLDVDLARKRISLSMKIGNVGSQPPRKKKSGSSRKKSKKTESFEDKLAQLKNRWK